MFNIWTRDHNVIEIRGCLYIHLNLLSNHVLMFFKLLTKFA